MLVCALDCSEDNRSRSGRSGAAGLPDGLPRELQKLKHSSGTVGLVKHTVKFRCPDERQGGDLSLGVALETVRFKHKVRDGYV